MSNDSVMAETWRQRLNRLLREAGFDLVKAEALNEHAKATLVSHIQTLVQLARQGQWEMVEKAAPLAGKICSGEIKLEAQDYQWVHDFLPVVLPPNWTRARGTVDGAQYTSVGGQSVIISGQRELDGKRWVHFSTGRTDRIPTWEELRDAKDIFLGDVTAYQVLPKRAKYVNINARVLHLFVCLDGDPLPDFTQGSGSL